MKDLTIIMLTLNKPPKQWAEYHKKVLLEATDGCPIITISKEPMDWGLNVIQTEEPSISNVFWQLLKGAKIATTDYIGVAEDDTLYSKEHFNSYRPDKDTFAYDQSRLTLFTWGKPTYSWRGRKVNHSLIAPRALLIETLEERFAKYPKGIPDGLAAEPGRNYFEQKLGVALRKSIDFYSAVPIINFKHDFASDNLQRRHRSRPGLFQAYDIPYWGKASELVAKFK